MPSMARSSAWPTCSARASSTSSRRCSTAPSPPRRGPFPASRELDELAGAVGFRRGNRDAERLDRIFAGYEGRALLPDRIQEILQLAAHGLLLSHVDFLLVVFEWNLDQVARILRSERCLRD